VGFERIIPASERPQTHALDRAATGTGLNTCNDVTRYEPSNQCKWFHILFITTQKFKQAVVDMYVEDSIIYSAYKRRVCIFMYWDS